MCMYMRIYIHVYMHMYMYRYFKVLISMGMPYLNS